MSKVRRSSQVPMLMLTAAPVGCDDALDPTLSELNGQGYSRTFIYGSYEGELVFAEPMLTKASLESRPNDVIEIPMAQRSRRAGVYSKAYAVRYIEATRRSEVALVNLVYRN